VLLKIALPSLRRS